MQINISTEQGRVPITVLHVDGNLDASSSQEFLTMAQKLVDGGARYLLVDLSRAPFVSSAGLRALHNLFNDLRSRNPDANLSEENVKRGINTGSYKSPHLKLLNLSPATKATFETSGFDMFIDTFTDKKAAIASF